MSDPVARPAHYARWKIEPIRFIMVNNLPYAPRCPSHGLSIVPIAHVLLHEPVSGLQLIRDGRLVLKVADLPSIRDVAVRLRHVIPRRIWMQGCGNCWAKALVIASCAHVRAGHNDWST